MTPFSYALALETLARAEIIHPDPAKRCNGDILAVLRVAHRVTGGANAIDSW